MCTVFSSITLGNQIRAASIFLVKAGGGDSDLSSVDATGKVGMDEQKLQVRMAISY